MVLLLFAGLGGRKEGREGEAELQMKLAELHSAIYLQASRPWACWRVYLCVKYCLSDALSGLS